MFISITFVKNCCLITVTWFFLQISSTKPKILSFINSFNFAFFVGFFADFTHFIHTRTKLQKYKNMHMYCQNCKKHAGNTFPKKLLLISKNKIKGKPKCAIYLTERTFIHEIEDISKWIRNLSFFFFFIIFFFFFDWCYKRTWKLIA